MHCLPSCSVQNASVTNNFGREITDAIGHWVVKGFACGPFDCPPVDRIQVNSILAVPQDRKVRAVLTLIPAA